MKIYALHSLWHSSNESGDELLLEGCWPTEVRCASRWSLDESIDARFASIDRQAIGFAEAAAHGGLAEQTAISFPYINALALRYYLVKLLRVSMFFRAVRPLAAGERVEAHLTAKRDEAYADIIEQLVDHRGASLELHWHEPRSLEARPVRRSLAWRHWADRARHWPATPVVDDDTVPRIVLCGNPRILNPVCAKLVERGCRLWWLYERFALRSWWRWRRCGVEQLVCDADESVLPQFSDVWCGADLMDGDINLARPVERWLVERAAELGQRQSVLIDRIEQHFAAIRPTALILDEDATPLKRVASALARRHGARSSVVQHGATCGRFGFVPPTTDEICVWGEPIREQLEAWGVEPQKIRVTGWPCLFMSGRDPASGMRERGGSIQRALPYSAYDQRNAWPNERPCQRRRTHATFLLLATVDPRDDRPDNVEFHLTCGNYAEMLEMVRDVLSRIEGARLIVKPHPRSRQTDSVRSLLQRQQSVLRVRIVRSKNLADLVRQSDCVISCGSTAGIEAALAGAPVVQLLPRGSGNILPAEDWGFIGTARTAQELATHVNAALSRGWCAPAEIAGSTVAARGDAAASAMIDGLLATCGVEEVLVGRCR